MKVYTSQSEMAENAKKVTYQNEFPLSTKCRHRKCGKTTLMMVVDDEGEVCNQPRPGVVRVWPHDSIAIALYLCINCGEITAEWNQG